MQLAALAVCFANPKHTTALDVLACRQPHATERVCVFAADLQGADDQLCDFLYQRSGRRHHHKARMESILVRQTLSVFLSHLRESWPKGYRRKVRSHVGCFCARNINNPVSCLFTAVSPFHSHPNCYTLSVSFPRLCIIAKGLFW